MKTMKTIMYLFCLVVLLGGCSSSDDYELQTGKNETAADKIYELADDYGLKVQVGAQYSKLSPEEVDLEKYENYFRSLAQLKGTHVVQGVKRNGSIVYKCVSKQKRRRSMSSENTSSYDFGIVEINYFFWGECDVLFYNYGDASSTYRCDVNARICSAYYFGYSTSNLKTTLKPGGHVYFSGNVSYTYEDYGEAPEERHPCVPSCRDCDPSNCQDSSCEFNCVCPDCLIAGIHDGNGKKIIVTFGVDGDCTENGGTIDWY